MLVVGGAGFIGSTLVDRLMAEGHEVDVVDDLSTGSLANLSEARANGPDGRLKFHHLDATSAHLGALVALRRPEVVFHLAALAPGASTLSASLASTISPTDSTPAGMPATNSRACAGST